MKFSSLFLFFFFLFLIPLASAQPPSFDPIILNQGIDIAFPQINVLKVNTDFEFHFHVVNESNGFMFNSTTIRCSFHLFNSTGNHIFENENVIDDTNGEDFSQPIDKNNFTQEGNYAFLFGCHNSTQQVGGQVRESFRVTLDGVESVPFPQQFSVIALGIILIMFGLFNQRYNLLKHMGSILLMIMGTLTLFPGYNNISHTSLFGLALGSSLIAIGFWFLIEDSFSRTRQEGKFEQDQGGEEFQEEERT